MHLSDPKVWGGGGGGREGAEGGEKKGEASGKMLKMLRKIILRMCDWA